MLRKTCNEEVYRNNEHVSAADCSCASQQVMEQHYVLEKSETKKLPHKNSLRYSTYVLFKQAESWESIGNEASNRKLMGELCTQVES